MVITFIYNISVIVQWVLKSYGSLYKTIIFQTKGVWAHIICQLFCFCAILHFIDIEIGEKTCVKAKKQVSNISPNILGIKIIVFLYYRMILKSTVLLWGCCKRKL